MKKSKRKKMAKKAARKPGIVAHSKSQAKRLKAQGAEPVVIATVDREPEPDVIGPAAPVPKPEA